MEDKINKQLVHINLLRILLLTFGLASAYVFYMNQFGDLDLLTNSLQTSSLVLLAFVFFAILANATLLGNEMKVRKVFDHLLLYVTLFYVAVYTIPFVNHMQNGTLVEVQDFFQVGFWDVIFNYLLIVVLTPLLSFTLLFATMRKVKTIEKNQKNDMTFGWSYYLLLLITVVVVGYSVMTPLYTMF